MYLVKILGGLGPQPKPVKFGGRARALLSPPHGPPMPSLTDVDVLPNVDVQIIKDDDNRKNVFF